MPLIQNVRCYKKKKISTLPDREREREKERERKREREREREREDLFQI